ncbi:MAG TPA: GDSL-type esterase/lipase family protein [Fimbriimonadaceae bacterium]|nr:GDSL-type esterase/lipase family protein [Fimbriimonadaceae bacterium]
MLATLVLVGAWVAQSDTDYHGFRQHHFVVAGAQAVVVEPKKTMKGAPWIWRTEFFDHRPMLDLALLERGFHLVHLEVGNTFGAPHAMEQFSAFYRVLTAKWLLNRRCVLEGFSRGGLYAYNWAFLNPDKVMAIYGDAPVCDFKTWPYRKSPDDWRQLLAAYGFPNERAALDYPYNPIDKLEPLAKAHIPIVHVVGDADSVVPMAENTGELEKRYKALGGTIQVIHKPGADHHPHSLDNPKPLVDFLLRHMRDTEHSPPATVIAAPNPESRYDSAGWNGQPWLAQHVDCIQAAKANQPLAVLLGDSITQGWGGPGRKVAAPGSEAFLRHLTKFASVNMGISGDRTQNLLWRIEHGALDGCKPEALVVLIGTNNRASDSPEAIAKGIEVVVEAAHHFAPEAQVIVMGVFPVGSEPLDPNREIVAQINKSVKGHLPRYAHFLDIGPDLLTPEGYADMGKMADDAIHLKPGGYEAWGRALERELDRYVK